MPTARYEYAVLVTSTQHEILTLAQLYRDRADAENNFDELKNQWGWGGFTTQDLARCRIMARMVAFVALVYNWWTRSSASLLRRVSRAGRARRAADRRATRIAQGHHPFPVESHALA